MQLAPLLENGHQNDLWLFQVQILGSVRGVSRGVCADWVVLPHTANPRLLPTNAARGGTLKDTLFI